MQAVVLEWIWRREDVIGDRDIPLPALERGKHRLPFDNLIRRIRCAVLPIALTYWEGLGYEVNESELLGAAERFGLPQYSLILDWARRIQPRDLSTEERDRYITQATTPGGVTEAILDGIRANRRLSAALLRGIHRSRELAAL